MCEEKERGTNGERKRKERERERERLKKKKEIRVYRRAVEAGDANLPSSSEIRGPESPKPGPKNNDGNPSGDFPSRYILRVPRVRRARMLVLGEYRGKLS